MQLRNRTTKTTQDDDRATKSEDESKAPTDDESDTREVEEPSPMKPAPSIAVGVPVTRRAASKARASRSTTAVNIAPVQQPATPSGASASTTTPSRSLPAKTATPTTALPQRRARKRARDDDVEVDDRVHTELPLKLEAEDPKEVVRDIAETSAKQVGETKVVGSRKQPARKPLPQEQPPAEQKEKTKSKKGGGKQLSVMELGCIQFKRRQAPGPTVMQSIHPAMDALSTGRSAAKARAGLPAVHPVTDRPYIVSRFGSVPISSSVPDVVTPKPERIRLQQLRSVSTTELLKGLLKEEADEEDDHAIVQHQSLKFHRFMFEKQKHELSMMCGAFPSASTADCDNTRDVEAVVATEMMRCVMRCSEKDADSDLKAMLGRK